MLAQAVSWLRAERTGAWYVGGNGEIGNVVVTGLPACYDAGRIGQLIRMIGEHNAAWEEWFASFGVQPYLVRYDELDADLAGVIRSILSFLGLDPSEAGAIVPQHSRQADGLNDQWAERYRAEASAGSLRRSPLPRPER